MNRRSFFKRFAGATAVVVAGLAGIISARHVRSLPHPKWRNYTSTYSNFDKDALKRAMGKAKAEMEFRPPMKLSDASRGVPGYDREKYQVLILTRDGMYWHTVPEITKPVADWIL